MNSKDKHRKHVSLSKPSFGEFGRNELAFLGAPCKVIQDLARELIHQLSEKYSIAYVDAEHTVDLYGGSKIGTAKSSGQYGKVHMTDKQVFTQFDNYHPLSVSDKRTIFNKEDLVLINGNHFPSNSQVLIVHPEKNMEKKLDRLKDVNLIILAEKKQSIPEFLKNSLPAWKEIPVIYLEEMEKIVRWTINWLNQKVPSINGLVLTGGESKRMQKDKGELNYHGKSQRDHLFSLLQPYCPDTFISCNARQAIGLTGKIAFIADSFLDLGPMGGILSAFRADPNKAWLVLACDLPYLSKNTINYLINHRNPSKIATAFIDPKGEFPEPLISIWEPKSYPVLLEYLGQGLTCPRKILINSEVELLEAPDKKELHNVNRPEEYEAVFKEIMMNQER